MKKKKKSYIDFDFDRSSSTKKDVKIAYNLEKWYNVVTTTHKSHGGICYGNYVITETG